MMSLDDIKKLEGECKQYLIKKTREGQPDATEFLTDEEVALMNPMTEMDLKSFVYLKSMAIIEEIMKEIKEKREERDFIESKLNSGVAFTNETSELRSDVANLEVQIFALEHHIHKLVADLAVLFKGPDLEDEQRSL